MTFFERMKKFYGWSWVTESQLSRYVELGRLSAEEYEEITGNPFSS